MGLVAGEEFPHGGTLRAEHADAIFDQRGTPTLRERERESQRERDRERESQRERESERERVRERERGRRRAVVLRGR